MKDNIRDSFDSKRVDPDGGDNIERKRQKLAESGHPAAAVHDSNTSFPFSGWSKSLKRLPSVSFPSIYHPFMENSLVTYPRTGSVPDD